jgi:hypothetical protein
VHIALRWIFVRQQASSLGLFWADVTRSFEKAIGRKFATGKRKMGLLEEQWRAKFAARDAESGSQGNNNSDLARAMRSSLAFRDEKELAKREKEEDMRALDVRRERLHELEAERLGLTEVCRYETMVGGEEEEEEEIGPGGVEINGREQSNGDRSNPIALEDEVEEEPRQTKKPPGDMEPTETEERSKPSDQIAPIVELLRRRQREEREEADIRREEQVLLNKRLAMMEEQVQMLSKLITKHEQDSLPAAPSRPVDEVMGESTHAPIDLESGTGSHTIAGSHAEAAAIVESNRASTASADTIGSGIAHNETVDTSEGTTAPIETAEHSPDVSMDGAEGMPADDIAGSRTEVRNINESTAIPMEITDASKSTAVPIEIVHTKKGPVARIEIAEYSPDVSMDGMEDSLGETPGESEVETPVAMLEAQERYAQTGESIESPETTEAESLAENPDSGQVAEAEADVSGTPSTTARAG